jgi:KDO2-lipid IV(A) lauroyltransferase
MYYVVFPILWLFSLLPFWVLYGISDFFFVFVFYVFRYRRDVVQKNLETAFPEKTEKERLKIEKQFYHNLIDTFLESIKFITISEKQLEKRSKGDFEQINAFIGEGKNIHIMAGHQFNWEFANLLYAKNLKIPFVGIYMQISNKILNRIFYNFRKRYGTVLISAQDFKNKMHSVFSGQYMLALAADQNPGSPENAYWMHFFGKPAPFVTGPSKGAVKYNTAVVLVGFYKIKRGHYHFKSQVLAEDASTFTPESLTIVYKKALEKIISDDPANYLWSHRRWKWVWKQEYGHIID